LLAQRDGRTMQQGVRPVDATPLVVSLHAHNDNFDDDHPAFRAQVAMLETELLHGVDGARRVSRSVPGTKGGVEEVVVALGQAGVLTMTVEMLRVWLHRDRARSLEISWTEAGETQRVTVRGEAIDTDVLKPVAEAAAARIGQDAWARSATAPS
jgi:hypothetical protein